MKALRCYGTNGVRVEQVPEPQILDPRQAIHACRKGGVVSIPGVYGGFLDKVPLGAAFNKGLTLRMGQTHATADYSPPPPGR